MKQTARYREMAKLEGEHMRRALLDFVRKQEAEARNFLRQLRSKPDGQNAIAAAWVINNKSGRLRQSA